MAKDKTISREQKKLKKIFENIPENKQKLVDNLIQNAAFMAVTLADLQEKIREDGPVITYVNGNGLETTSEHPAQKSYNTMINRYATVIKQLADLLPDSKEERSASAGEALASFVVRGK